MFSKARILIVDDNPNNVSVLQELFEDGNRLEIAYSGEECLKKATDFRPDIILLDVMMPGIDGYETCRQLRNHADLIYTKIIMVSAKAMISERLQGYKVGADDYITKPFNKDELYAKVQNYRKLKTIEELDGIKTDLIKRIIDATNSPLNALLKHTDSLLSDESLSEKNKEILDAIWINGRDLHTFFEKALLLSALKLGKIELSLLAKSITPLIENVLKHLKPVAETKNIQFFLNSTISNDVLFDEEQMMNALTYVIENAIKYSPEGGKVSVLAERDDKNYLIRVTDQGEGIKSGYWENIFYAFAIQDINNEQIGSGLSLALARNILELHGGDLIAETNEANETAFTLKWPIYPGMKK